jgi:hypothetical protein
MTDSNVLVSIQKDLNSLRKKFIEGKNLQGEKLGK